MESASGNEGSERAVNFGAIGNGENGNTYTGRSMMQYRELEEDTEP
jgi:hypothetical protein